MKTLPSNSPVALSGCAVPIGFNVAKNRYPQPILCVSDTTNVLVWFYEYHGLYWFCWQANGKSINSVPYVSARSCVCGLRSNVRLFGLRFDDLGLAVSRFKAWRSSFVPSRKSLRV